MRLKELRLKKGMTLKDLSQKIGLSPQVINRYERGEREADYNTLTKLANYFNVSIDFLIERDSPPNEEVIYFPIIATIQAGYGKQVTEEEYTEEKMPIPKYMIHGDPTNYFVLQIHGDSMAPHYFEGDCVLMERTDIVDSGQTAAVCIGDEEATLKRVIYDERHSFIRLEPFNDQYSPRTFTGEEMQSIRIIGAVKRLIREVY